VCVWARMGARVGGRMRAPAVWRACRDVWWLSDCTQRAASRRPRARACCALPPPPPTPTPTPPRARAAAASSSTTRS
jgi:hypothetical protein